VPYTDPEIMATFIGRWIPKLSENVGY